MTKRAPRDLRKAKELWRIFHAKDTPRELIELHDRFPRDWDLVGQCRETLYSSDKWERDGDYVGYYHIHDGGLLGGTVELYAPAGDVAGAEPQSPGITKWPDAGTVLGTADGFLIESGNGEREAVCGKDALLCAFPDGSVLFVWDPKDGIVALVVGDPLTVGEDGIEG